MTKKQPMSFKTYVFLFLLAAELLMSFTFFGYIHLPPISITFAYIPVLLAGCFLGVSQATAVGFLFGLASLYKASAYYVQPVDQAFSPFFSGMPVQSMILSVGTRTVFGLLIGLLFLAAKRSKHPRLWIAVLALLSPRFHALLVYAALMFLFPDLGYHVSNTFVLSVSDFLVSLFCLLLIESIWNLSKRPAVQKFCHYAIRSNIQKKRLPAAWGTFLGCSACAAVAAAYYFSQRTSHMLETYGIHLSDNTNYDLLHLQIQFLIAEIALNLILVLSLLLVYRYLSYQEYLEGLDDLTGVMGRKMFLQHCSTLEGTYASFPDEAGWFLFLDVDHFKSINDTYGHPAGDEVLKDVATELSRVFETQGKVGRMGGDEFAVILEKAIPPKELAHRLDEFLKCVSGVLPAPQAKVTCSIGACRFSYPLEMHTIYGETDQLLYTAKNNGRACYVLGAYNGTSTQIMQVLDDEISFF